MYDKPCGIAQRTFGRDAAKVLKDVGFSDATRDVWVTRIVAWRRRSAQAGNRGVGLGGCFIAMGIGVMRVLLC